MESDVLFWTAIASAGAAWIALMLSLIGLRSSWRALRLSELQDERTQPLLVPYLQDGYVRFDQGGESRIFAFLLSVSNRSDSDNAMSELNLRLTYTTKAGVEMTVKIPSNANGAHLFDECTEPALPSPRRIDAHQTVSGWCYFQVKNALLKDRMIERHSIAIIDSHGIEASVEPIMVREYSSETHTTTT